MLAADLAAIAPHSRLALFAVDALGIAAAALFALQAVGASF
jgi:hypothetical protein